MQYPYLHIVSKLQSITLYLFVVLLLLLLLLLPTHCLFAVKSLCMDRERSGCPAGS